MRKSSVDHGAKRVRREAKRRHKQARPNALRTERRRPVSDDAVHVADLEAALKSDFGIIVEGGSAIERAYLTLDWLRDVHDGKLTIEHPSQGVDVVHACGIVRLARGLLKLRESGFWDRACGHLELLAGRRQLGPPMSPDVLVPALAQNVRTRHADQDTRKVFELVVGMLAFRLDPEMELESPRSGKPSDNPDVLLRYRGVTWGLACKTLNSPQPHTLLDLIEKGAEQICRSRATRGMVIISPISVLPRGDFLSEEDAAGNLVRRLFRSGEEAASRVHVHANRLIDAALDAAQATGWREVVPDPRRVPLVAIRTEETVVIKRLPRNAWQSVVVWGHMPTALPEHPSLTAANALYQRLSRE